jgi:hypothetical protein
MLLVSSAPALAQSERLQLAVGGAFRGAASAGTTEASLLDSSGAPLVLYRSTNRVTFGKGAEGLISSQLRDGLRLELGVAWVRAKFESRISSDFEDVPDVSATQSFNQYAGEVALVWRVMQQKKFDVFVRGGVGGFREITSDRALVDNGWRATVGGGTQYRLREAASGWLGHLALRADIRLQVRGAGIEFGESRTRVSPSLFAGLVFGQ